MITYVGFVISEEDLVSAPGTRLDHSELLCSRVLLQWKRDRESFWHRHQKEDGEYPPHSSYQGLIYFYQTHSHNTHLKLTRTELTIERSYQTHSHSKIARLARRYLLRRRNMSLSKIHWCYIIISTEKHKEKLKEKHTLEQSELFCCVIISSRLKES